METHCVFCGEVVCPERWALGYASCLTCGEHQAQEERKHWCVAPMHKSNYLLITNPQDLRGLNNKGGFHR